MYLPTPACRCGRLSPTINDMSVAAPEAAAKPDPPPETTGYRNLYILLLLQYRRTYRSRAGFQFALLPGHRPDRLGRAGLSLFSGLGLPALRPIQWPPRSCSLAFSALSPPQRESPFMRWAAARWVRRSDSSRRGSGRSAPFFFAGRFPE